MEYQIYGVTGIQIVADSCSNRKSGKCNFVSMATSLWNSLVSMVTEVAPNVLVSLQAKEQLLAVC